MPIKCLEVNAFGPPTTMDTVERALPTPSAGEVRIRVEATGLGFVDGLLVSGRYQIRPPLPYVPGGEIVGVVEALGPQVRRLSLGDRVATWQLGGGLAQAAIVREDDAARLPGGLDSRTAAAIVLDFPTARYALLQRGNLREGETVLVLGAAGGVGAAATQIAAAAGAYVIAAASSAAKRNYAASMGAAAVVDSASADIRRAIQAAAPRGVVDLVVDPVGGPNFESVFRSLAKEGRHLVVGFAGGPIPTLRTNLALLKSAALVGVDLRQFFAGHPAAAREARDWVFEAVASGVLKPPAINSFGFDHAREAVESVGQRDKPGKIVVVADRPE